MENKHFEIKPKMISHLGAPIIFSSIVDDKLRKMCNKNENHPYVLLYIFLSELARTIFV